MYEVTIQISYKNQVIEETVQLGLRKLEFIKSPFHFLINDQPIFMKGSTLLPMDYYPDRMHSEEEVKWLVDSTIASNLNLIRIYGGGMFMTDFFYDYCDQNGVMVWQDLMFNSRMYPVGDEKFESSAEIEVREVVGRLQYHPSIIYWAMSNDGSIRVDRWKKEWLENQVANGKN